MHYHVSSECACICVVCVRSPRVEMWHIIMLKRFIHVFALIMCEIKIYAHTARCCCTNVCMFVIWHNSAMKE